MFGFGATFGRRSRAAPAQPAGDQIADMQARIAALEAQKKALEAQLARFEEK